MRTAETLPCPSSIRHRSLADIHEILTAPKRALLTEPFIVSACTIFIDYMGACRSLKTNYLRIRMRTHTQTEHIYENYYNLSSGESRTCYLKKACKGKKNPSGLPCIAKTEGMNYKNMLTELLYRKPGLIPDQLHARRMQYMDQTNVPCVESQEASWDLQQEFR